MTKPTTTSPQLARALLRKAAACYSVGHATAAPSLRACLYDTGHRYVDLAILHGGLASSSRGTRADGEGRLRRVRRALRNAHGFRLYYRRELRLLCGVCVLTSCLGIWQAGHTLYDRFSRDGLRVRYYGNESFQHRVATRGEDIVFKDYDDDAPAIGVRAGSFSARWDGFLMVPSNDEYQFYLQVDEVARLWIDDRLVVEKRDDLGWKAGGKGRVFLASGPHRLLLEHVNRRGPAAIRLRWCGGGIPANTVLSAPYIRKTPF